MPFQHGINWLPIHSGCFHSDMRHVSGFEPLAQTQDIRGHGAEALALLVALPPGVRSTGTSSHTPLMHIESCAAFIDNVHGVLHANNGRATGCPAWVKFSHTCFPMAGATDGGA